MTSEQLIERIAEVLFKEEEIDAWDIYDTLEAIFSTQRPDLIKKYQEWVKNEEIRQREQEVINLATKLNAARVELDRLKENA